MCDVVEAARSLQGAPLAVPGSPPQQPARTAGCKLVPQTKVRTGLTISDGVQWGSEPSR